jgi:hypothetical protein
MVISEMNPTLAPQAQLREQSDSAAREVASDKTVTLQTSPASVMFVQRNMPWFCGFAARRGTAAYIGSLYYERHCKSAAAGFHARSDQAATGAGRPLLYFKYQG